MLKDNKMIRFAILLEILLVSNCIAQEKIIIGFTGTFKAPPAIGERLRRADIVVRGTPMATQMMRFRDDPSVPPAEDIIYERGAYEDVVVRVDEYLKGSGPATIKVRFLTSTPELERRPSEVEALPPPLGKPLVLLLSRGQGPFEGAYLILGKYDVGEVNDAHGVVLFQLTEEAAELEELRRAISHK